jgi:hypothetical protein
VTTDLVLRALGADPASFRPLFRLYNLLPRRSKNLLKIREGGASAFTPRTLLYVMAGSFGMAAALLIRITRPSSTPPWRLPSAVLAC